MMEANTNGPLRAADVQKEAQFEVGNAVTNQQFFPAYWLIRIHEDEKRMLKRTAEEEEEEDSLAHAFRGTKIH